MDGVQGWQTTSRPLSVRARFATFVKDSDSQAAWQMVDAGIVG
jgi:hypothetical protein